MTNEMQVYKELEQQLKEAHQLSTALWVGEIDAIVIKLNVSLLCSKDPSDFLLQEKTWVHTKKLLMETRFQLPVLLTRK